MKKLVFTFVLCFLVAASFAQKKAISAAKAELRTSSNNTSTVNIAEARSQIQGALQNPETANDPEAWYVAGLVENKQYDTEKAKELLGLDANEDLMYPALDQILPYFLKADELEQIPDAKGKIKMKFRKDMREIMRINRPYYINAGVYFYDKGNHQKAYENFKAYGDIPNLPLFEGYKDTENEFVSLASDTNAIKIRYYAALSAIDIPNHEAAIELFNEIKDLGYNENDMYKHLGNEYAQINDTVNWIKTLEEGVVKFPDEEYYILNLINLNIRRGETDKSVNYLQQALTISPEDAQLWDVLGLVYESTKENNKAIESIKKAIEFSPNNADYYSHLGRLYYNLGVDTRANADAITDKVLFEQESQKSIAYFKEALPYYEKAYELNPEDSDAVFALRNIYYNLGMNEEYEKMDKIYMGE